MNRRKSSIKSARTFRLAASAAAKPRSSNTLSLPGMICRSLPSLSRWAARLLDRLIALPASREVELGRLLCFLLECVEYIDGLLKLRDIEHPVGIGGPNANFIGPGPTTGMGLKSLGLCPCCTARNSKPAFRRASRGTVADR